MRIVFAIAVAGLAYLAIPGATHAAPIAPPPAGFTSQFNDLTEAGWRRCWRDRWGRTRCTWCWRDRWGRVRCR
jgi:hypothetical protein